MPPILQLAITLEPLIVPLIADVAALFKKHPQLTSDALSGLIAEIHATNADTLATIAADQASQK